MPGQANQIYNQVIYKSWYLIGQSRYLLKGESLRATSLSKLDSKIKSNSVFNSECAEFSTEWYVLFHFYDPTCAYNHSYNLHQKFSSTNFNLFIPPLLVHKIILIIPTSTPFFYAVVLFHLPIFAYSHPLDLPLNYFPYLSHLGNSSCVKGPMSKRVLWGLTLF